MKQVFYEVPLFIVAIVFALIFMGKDFNNSPSVNLSTLTLNEVSTCVNVDSCISQVRITREGNKKLNPVKEIKAFLRHKIY
ncbi:MULTISPECIES: hypothetical protein [Providencia]|uniref:hypothetical protein n=1 Tax=Providencia TaxID=586 RepID=UPI000D6FA74C|nr:MULTISPECIES: hypothetical protein [Providencia]AWS51984.1 hypothetical protein AM461_14745 [Providencia rettgeri]MCG5291143.1 hypothetical protein [Providencia rettgeri]MCL0020848.1 hypothetical protein [Providencia rettgeri]MDM9282377.1 hypothetical protein [Providencia rettgeri]QZY66007.1 hypothetical protein K7H99_08255 [Providencia rettgeri]